MDNKNIWLIPINEEPIKGDLLLRHIWKGTEHECRSLWQYDETITIDDVKQYTTLNGSFRDYYKCFKPQYLYATSKEPYQKGDWVKNVTIELEPPFKLDAHGIRYTQISPCKFEKVVLTTDRYLIADGVQVLPDEFIEWFLKNSTCEQAEIEKGKVVLGQVAGTTYTDFNYEIIIPKKEPQQEFCDNCNNEACCCAIKTQETLKDKLEKLVEEWQKRQHRYQDVAQEAINQETDRKFTYKAMATRDCWKELLKIIQDEQ